MSAQASMITAWQEPAGPDDAAGADIDRPMNVVYANRSLSPTSWLSVYVRFAAAHPDDPAVERRMSTVYGLHIYDPVPPCSTVTVTPGLLLRKAREQGFAWPSETETGSRRIVLTQVFFHNSRDTPWVLGKTATGEVFTPARLPEKGIGVAKEAPHISVHAAMPELRVAPAEHCSTG